MEKKLIVFIDSGDTLIDEATQEYDAHGYVTRASLIPGAEELLDWLYEQEYTVALVADGEKKSFSNIYRENGRAHCFQAWIISEVVGEQKPAPIMFDTAMKELHLEEKDKYRVVMIGNNLKKDIAGANRYGITSVWMDWSPRYYHSYEEADWNPTYRVTNPWELMPLLQKLELRLERSC